MLNNFKPIIYYWFLNLNKWT